MIDLMRAGPSARNTVIKTCQDGYDPGDTGDREATGSSPDPSTVHAEESSIEPELQVAPDAASECRCVNVNEVTL